MENKFRRVMDWGTPRLITKNRALTMNQKQMESRSLLLKSAGIRAIPGGRGQDEQKTKTGYTNESVTNFRKRMMEEERRSEAKTMQHNDLTRKGTANAGVQSKANNAGDEDDYGFGEDLEKRISYERLP